MFLVRVLRIHSVQSVMNNPTQLSGRGFPYIVYIKIMLSQLYVVWCSRMEAGPCSFQMFEIVVQKICFSKLFEDPFCTKCNLRAFVLTHVILAPGARGRGRPSSS